MPPDRPPCPYDRHTERHPKKKLHRRLCPDTRLAVRAFLLTEYDRCDRLVAQYTENERQMTADPGDVMLPFVTAALNRYIAVRGYLTAVLHNLNGMHWLDTDLKAAFKAADEQAPTPVGKQLEFPEAK